MKSIWIARDKETGELWGFIDKPPIKGENAFEPYDYDYDSVFDIKDELFPEITWENSPVEFIENTKEEQQ